MGHDGGRDSFTEDPELERAFESPLTNLPESRPKGWLGGIGFDPLKPDDHEPDLNAGLLHENDRGVTWLAIVLGLMLFFVPGTVILWLLRRIPVRTKVVALAAVAALAGYPATAAPVHR